MKVFTASGIAMCSNYLDSEVCVDDPSGVGQDSCGPETTDCECSWNSESSLCQGVGLGGLCRYSSETLGEATCEAGDQFIEIRVTGTWSGARPDPQGLDLKCETPVTRVLECPAQIALPFFGIYGILITVLLVVGVYGVLSLRSNRRKSRKR